MTLPSYKLIDKATKAVPATKYAIGVLGIASIVVLISEHTDDLQIAFWGIVVMLGLMIILLLFAKMTQTANEEFKKPARFLMWFVVLIFIFSCTFLLTSTFFGWPQIHSLLKNDSNRLSKKVLITPLPSDSLANLSVSTDLSDTVKRLNQIPNTDIKIISSPKAKVVVGDNNRVNN